MRKRRILRLAVTACIAGAAGISGCGSIPDVNPGIAEAWRLGDARTGTDRLVALSGDPDAEVRRAAVVALGSVGGDGAAAALTARLDDEVPGVRYAAAFALGRIGAVEPLRALLTADDGNLRLLAVRGVGHGGAAGDVESLAARLANDDRGPVRGEAAIALGRIATRSGDGSCAATVRAALVARFGAESDADVRWRIVFGLAWLAVPGVESTLIAAATASTSTPRFSPERTAIAFALRGLGRLPSSDAVVGALLPRLDDADPSIAAAAIDALGRQGAGGDPGRTARIARALGGCVGSEASPTLRAAACAALAAVGDHGDDALEVLDAAFGDPSPVVRGAALVALAGLRGAAAVDQVRTGEQDGDWRVRAAAARACALLPAELAVDPLRRGLADPDLRVRLAAVEALVAHAASPVVRPLIVQAATERDPAMREAVAAALAATGDPAVVPVLRKAFDDSRGPLFAHARVALLRAADAVDAGGDAVRPWLTQATEDPVESVRDAANAALERRGTPIADAARWRDPVTDPVPGAGIPLEFLDGRPVVRFVTRHGSFDVALVPGLAPVHAWRMLQLAVEGRYAERPFHGVEPGQVVHGGDARGDGYDAVSASMRTEIDPMPFLAGTVGAWRRPGRDQDGDEFFITLLPAPGLDGQFTAFGRVVRGLDVVERIEPGDVVEEVVALGAGAEAPMPPDGR